MKFSIAVKYYQGLYALIQIYKRRVNHENFMKKAAAAMIAMLAVVAVFGTSVPAQAASKAPKSLSVKVTTKTVDIKGKSTISVKSVKPANASKAVTYKSSNKKIATVSSKGVVTGKKAGKVNITVTSKKNKKVKKVVKITVKNLKPSSVKVSAVKATVVVGKTNTLKAAVKPAGVYCPVKWTSSNKAVATVSSNGKVTGKKAGTATITVKATQKNSKGKYLSTTCKVTVVDKTPASVSKQQVYVSPEWLKSAMSGLQKGYENVFVSEVAWGDTAGDKNYNAGHIPGAYHINSDAVEYDDCDPWPYGDGKDDFGLYDEKDVKPEDNFNIRSGKQLSEFLKRNGITKDTKVVLYGRSASDSSVTRVAFAMLYAGVEDVKVVDGGMQAWKAAGYDVETKVNEQKAGGDDYSFGTTVPAHPEYILSAEDAKDKLQNDANFRLVSIRSTKEFEGEETGYGYIDYAGEPLGAVWGHNTDDGSYVENGKVVGIDKVKSILAESDSSLDNELSFYCGTGWRATIPFLICYQNGVKNISVYDGGWWLWQLNWQKDKAAWPIQDVSADVAKNYAQLSFAAEEVNKDASGKMLVAGASAAENKLACWPARVSSKVVYGSSDKKVATVDATGKVTAVAAGEATITARTKAGNKATYKVVVSPAQ